ncbi:MAG: excinuclease ABC subunit UvrA, partial [Candidatus Dormibacteraceae bacterium]
MPTDSIVIRGAREHNLKNVSLALPRDRLIVFTGLSGSGKSSLAFDTIYAEGQRRYVESLSAYARQFLGQVDKPDVDVIEGLSPAISIDQKGTSRNPRSTVGTVTEIHDYLRLLFARIGVPHCPVCGREIHRQTVEQMADRVDQLGEGSRLLVLGPAVRGRKGEYQQLLQDIRKQGFNRVRVDGEMYLLDEDPEIPMERYKQHDVEVVVDRLVLGPEQRTRLVDSLETASKLGQGTVLIVDAAGEREDLLMSQAYACPYDGTQVAEPEPRNFSFNSPYGACPTCTGLGTQMVVDPDLVVPDQSLTLRDGAIAPWSRSQFFYPELLAALAEAHEIDLDTPWRDLPRKQRDLILHGAGREKIAFSYRNHYGQRRRYQATYEGVLDNVQRRYDETESDFLKQELEKYLGERPCPACKGTRLKPASLAVTVTGRSIAEVSALTVTGASDFFAGLQLGERDTTIARGILKEIGERLRFMLDVGLDYLTLARASTTLSGGESQRIRLATQIGSKLVGVLYILDEPSIGLHQRDNHRLIETLVRLRDLGNTLIVVEHDEDTIRASDWVVDVGPGAGEHGGVVVASGPLEEVLRHPTSLTAAFLRGDRAIAVPEKRRRGNGKRLVVRGARANNLKDLDVSLPLGT